MNATTTQQQDVKSLAQAVLERNRRNSERNSSATTELRTPATAMSNSLRNGSAERSHGIPLAELPDPSTATEPFNQEAMDAIRRGQAVPVWSELLGEWLIWVRGEAERKRLLAQGCRTPIYTLGELALVVSWPDGDIRTAHAVKKQFNGVIDAAGKPIPRPTKALPATQPKEKI